MNLAARRRPKTFSQVAGQKAVTVVLERSVNQSLLDYPMIFEGPTGTGKTTTARILAKALNCLSDSKPCLDCVSCEAIEVGASISVLELDAASNGSVTDIRRLQESLIYAGGGRKVIIIDEAHQLSREAFDALLKILEEPVKGVVFVLVTTSATKIPETVQTRCVTFTFKKLTEEIIKQEVQSALKDEGRELSAELIQEISYRANGSMRSALVLTEQVLISEITTTQELHVLYGEFDFAVELLTAISQGDIKTTYAVLDSTLARTTDYVWITTQLVNTFKYILIIHSGAAPALSDVKNKELQILARRISAVQAIAGMKIIWESKTRLRPVESSESSLQIIVALLLDTLSDTLNTVSLSEIEGLL